MVGRGCNSSEYEPREPTIDAPVFITSTLLTKFSTGKPGTYVLNSASHWDHKAKFAVALSDNTVKVYDVAGKLLDEYAHQKNVTDLQYCTSDASYLFTSSLDGKLKVWDSRCQGAVQTFEDNSDGTLKPLLCFDYSVNEQLFCAGTEVFREDAFLLFWDRRSSKLLGGYWNSHTDDVTQVKFHRYETPCMASSSSDGLINVFNLRENTEADALEYTLNAESAINKLFWAGSKYLSCVTSMEEYQIWHVEGAKPSFRTSKEESKKIDYLIGNINIKDHYYMVSGTHDGMVYLWNCLKESIEPSGSLSRGHSDIVRTICCNTQENIILTGGEDGCVSLWKFTSE